MPRRMIALIFLILTLLNGCAALHQASDSITQERIVEDSTGKYRIIVCPHCGKQIKIPF